MSVLRTACLAGAMSLAAPGFAQAPSEGATLCPAAAAAIDASARKTLAQGSPGMVVQVAQDGRLLFTGSYGLANLEHHAPVTGDTVFRLASITKQFTAAATLLLVDEGRISLDDRLSRYVPELAQADQVTIYQLLAQTSGIPDYAADPELAATRSVARTPAQMLGRIAALTPAFEFEPGTRWAYSNSNYALLGLVIERVSGRDLQTFYRERLFGPAGMTATVFDDPADVVPGRAAGYRRAKDAPAGFRNAHWLSPTIPGAAGGVRGTAGDLVRWSEALFGGRILKADSLKALASPALLGDGRTTRFGMPAAWQQGLDSDYGLGTFVKPTPGGQRLGHSGDMDGFSTWVAHYPQHRVTIVHMINSESADMDTAAIEQAVFSGPESAVCVS